MKKKKTIIMMVIIILNILICSSTHASADSPDVSDKEAEVHYPTEDEMGNNQTTFYLYIENTTPTSETPKSADNSKNSEKKENEKQFVKTEKNNKSATMLNMGEKSDYLSILFFLIGFFLFISVIRYAYRKKFKQTF